AFKGSRFASPRRSIGYSAAAVLFWMDRYRARALTTPREVRHSLVYILQNFRKHLAGVRGLDPRSSAPWFAGWRQRITAPPGRPPVAAPRTWLACVGWRRHGLVGIDEVPHPPVRRRTARLDS